MTPDTPLDRLSTPAETVIVLSPGELLTILAPPPYLTSGLSGNSPVRHRTLKLALLMNCSLKELADLLRRSPSNLKRRPEKNAALQVRLRLLARLASIVIQVTNLSYFQTWLRSPVPALMNRKPISVLEDESGAEYLLNVISDVLSGSFT